MPMKPFMVHVESLIEARLLLDALADYDNFQFENNVKPDFANMGGLSVWMDALENDDGTKGGWCDWYSENGQNIDYYSLGELRELSHETLPVWEGAEIV